MKTLKTILAIPLLATLFSISSSNGADLTTMCNPVTCTGKEVWDNLTINNCLSYEMDGLEKKHWCYTGSSGTMYYTDECKGCQSNEVLVVGPGFWSGRANCNVPVKRCMDKTEAIEAGLACPDECPSKDSWTQVGSTGVEAICRGGQGVTGYQVACEYRCKSGYYPTSGSSGMTKPTCTTCPANATCNGGDSLPSCVKDYYREKDTGVGTRYKCTRCPGYYVGDTITFGQTVSAGATAKSQCYEAQGIGHVKKELKFPNDISIGKYNILQDKACFFTE